MKKYISLFALVSVLALAPTAQAQTTPTSTATSTPRMTLPGLPAVAACVQMERNVGLGARDGDANYGQVAALQRVLAGMGHLRQEFVTGYFGSLTAQAVRAYQKENGIPATGFLGPMTRAKINRSLCQHPAANGLTMIDPKGGEMWLRNTSQKIVWADANRYIQAQTYSIMLILDTTCPKEVKCELFMSKPYTIATSTLLSTDGFTWNVGTVVDQNRTLPDGKYKISICTTGAACVQSNDINISSSLPAATSTR